MCTKRSGIMKIQAFHRPISKVGTSDIIYLPFEFILIIPLASSVKFEDSLRVHWRISKAIHGVKDTAR
jgi:hypothetical protein